jgi:hypothetical protein
MKISKFFGKLLKTKISKAILKKIEHQRTHNGDNLTLLTILFDIKKKEKFQLFLNKVRRRKIYSLSEYSSADKYTVFTSFRIHKDKIIEHDRRAFEKFKAFLDFIEDENAQKFLESVKIKVEFYKGSDQDGNALYDNHEKIERWRP